MNVAVLLVNPLGMKILLELKLSLMLDNPKSGLPLSLPRKFSNCILSYFFTITTLHLLSTCTIIGLF